MAARPVILSVAVFILCVIQHSRANEYVYQPLKSLPTNVSYFANDPKTTEDGERRGITKNELEQIMRNGVFNNDYKDWASLRKNLIDKGIHGIFFDQEGNGYRWNLIDENILHVESASGCSGYVTGNYASITPITIPYEKEKPSKLSPGTIKAVGVYRDKPVHGPVIEIKKERINNILQYGNVANNDDPCEYLSTGKITDDVSGKVYYRYPVESSRQSSQGMVSNKSDGRITSGQKTVVAIQITGSILATDGKLYFWDIKDDNHLHLEDEYRNGCVLSIAPLEKASVLQRNKER